MTFLEAVTTPFFVGMARVLIIVSVITPLRSLLGPLGVGTVSMTLGFFYASLWSTYAVTTTSISVPQMVASSLVTLMAIVPTLCAWELMGSFARVVDTLRGVHLGEQLAVTDTERSTSTDLLWQMLLLSIIFTTGAGLPLLRSVFETPPVITGAVSHHWTDLVAGVQSIWSFIISAAFPVLCPLFVLDCGLALASRMTSGFHASVELVPARVLVGAICAFVAWERCLTIVCRWTS